MADEEGGEPVLEQETNFSSSVEETDSSPVDQPLIPRPVANGM